MVRDAPLLAWFEDEVCKPLELELSSSGGIGRVVTTCVTALEKNFSSRWKVVSIRSRHGTKPKGDNSQRLVCVPV
jgi:hypothetical protein